ncbi:hypothetical protein D3877_28025 [Azospirillum cavernae]|uniref:Tetratricopeptide repeat protein n=1 Tax=Azospirillum cavernae TaxID=2320860 RepID=A0A418VKR8_9PROT|nr:hypothetical protein [Azospirillum cavernae]RJF76747.1 hypothetical protein D3877_28025 [Azospirillum cavernae]
MSARDPVTAQFLRYSAQWSEPLLHSARIILEAVGMRRILASAMPRLGVPLETQAPYRLLAMGAASGHALEQADRMLALIAETRPEEFRAHFWRGLLCLERGDPQAALPHLERAAAWFSGSALAFFYASRIERARSWRGRETPRLAAAVAAAPELPAARRRLADIRRAANPAAAAAQYLAVAHHGMLPLYGQSFAQAQAEAQTRLAVLKSGDSRKDEPLTEGDAPVCIRPLRAGQNDLERYCERALDTSLRNPPMPGSPVDRPDAVHILPLYHIGYTLVRWRERFYAVDWRIGWIKPHHLESTPDRPVPNADTVAALQRLIAAESASPPF